MADVFPIRAEIEARARAHQDQLTKPQGALGRLEDIACWLAARQGDVRLRPIRPFIAVFAGDHGVCAEGVSAYPSAVTAEMVRNFARGGAAINVLARKIGAELAVVDVGVAADLEALANVRRMKVRHGAGNICREPAMTPQECARAMDVGKALAREAEERGANLLIAGEMGIGNTTPSACLIAWATGAPPDAIVGRGTGVDEEGLVRKREAVRRALRRAQPSSPLEALAQLGGLEIAAIVGFYMEAARIGVPVLLDGFISAAAALIAEAIQPGTKQWMLASHRSAEQGHARALAALGLAPLFDLGMRLGEGTGAALAVPIVQAAVALHNEMATFAEAGVHGRSDAP